MCKVVVESLRDFKRKWSLRKWNEKISALGLPFGIANYYSLSGFSSIEAKWCSGLTTSNFAIGEKQMKIDVNDWHRIRELYLQCALLGNKAFVYPDGTVTELHREDGCCPFPSENALAITPEYFTPDDYESIGCEDDGDWENAVDCYLEENGDFERLFADLDRWYAENHLRDIGFEQRQIERICEDESVKANGYGEIMRLKDPSAIAVMKELIG